METRVKPIVLWALGVFAVALWMHWPVTANGVLSGWDDDLYLKKAEQLQKLSLNTLRWAFTATKPFYYHPLTWLSHVLDYQLWGAQYAGHHAGNVVLHALNSVLVVWLMWLVASTAPNVSSQARAAMAGGVGLVFAVHPLQVEAVAWLAERKTLLCALFSLASLCAYAGAVRRADPKPLLWAATGLYMGALLAKPMAVSLPLVMLALDYFPLRRYATAGWWRLVKEKAVPIALSGVMCVVTLASQSEQGAVRNLGQVNVVERVLVAVRGIVFYVWKLVWPAWLSPFYPLGGDISLGNKEYFNPSILFIVFTALFVWSRKRTPALVAAWVAFLALILPVSGLFQAGAQAAADRFMYLAMVPLLMAAAAGYLWVWRHGAIAGRVGLVVLLCSQVILFGVRTRSQIAVWQNDVTVWSTALAYFPDSSVANTQMARALVKHQFPEEALAYAERAMELAPTHPLSRSTLALVNTQIAATLAQRHQFALAAPYATRAAEIAPDEPAGHAVLGLVLLKAHQYEKAAAELEKSLKRDDSLPAARYNLACAYSRLGRFDVAMEQLRMLFALEPRSAQLAERDPELADLRNDPHYAEQFRALLEEVNPP